MSLQCAASVLATMPRPSLVSLKEAVTAAKTGLTAVKTGKEAALASLNITLTGLQIARAALATTISTIQADVRIVPQEAIAKCNELGQLNYIMAKAASFPVQAASDALFDIERLYASKMSFNLEIKQLDDAIAFFDDILDAVDQALTSVA